MSNGKDDDDLTKVIVKTEFEEAGCGSGGGDGVGENAISSSSSQKLVVKYGRRTLVKGTPAYFEMRQRNNQAIHKHRQKKRDELKVKTEDIRQQFTACAAVDAKAGMFVPQKYRVSSIDTLSAAAAAVFEMDHENDAADRFIYHEYPKLKKYFTEHKSFDESFKHKIRRIFNSLEFELNKYDLEA